jgi:DNA-binding MarR family transcriptional regulator
MVTRENGLLHITDAGRAAADRLFAARHQLLENLVADWSPEQHAEVAELLTRLSRDLLGEEADRGVLASPVPGPAVASG